MNSRVLYADGIIHLYVRFIHESYEGDTVMKKRTHYSSKKTACVICAIMLATIPVLASCKKDSDLTTPTTTSYSSPVSYVGNSAPKPKEKKPEYNLTRCYEKNTQYDLSAYRISDEKEVHEVTGIDVSEADLKSYATDKLDYILQIDDISVRGLYQDYEVEIVRIDRFNDWYDSYDFYVYGYFMGGLYIGYDKGIADGGALKETQVFDLYKDPSGCFILVSACRDFKVISDFFENGSRIKGGLALSVADYNKEIYEEFVRTKVCTEDQALEWSKDHSIVVFENGVCTSGEGFWGGFYKSVNEGNNVFVMMSKYYTPDEEHAGEELYRPRLIFYFIEYRNSFDNDFRLLYRNSRGNYSTVEETRYRHLLRFYGRNDESSEYAFYNVFVLSNNKDLTWEDVQKGISDYPYPSENFCIVYQELYGKKP